MVGVLGYMPQNFSKASEYANLVRLGFDEGTLSIPPEDIVGSSEPTLTEDTLVSEVRVYSLSSSLSRCCPAAVPLLSRSGNDTLWNLL